MYLIFLKNLSIKFVILRIIDPDIIKNVFRASCKVPVIIVRL